MKTVLIVDDSELILNSMNGILKRFGFTVDTASGGQEALDYLANTTPDLVITDLNMPGMDGITLIKEIKKMKAMRFKPILMLTTESSDDKRQEAKEAGAMGWLVKPVRPAELKEMVKEVFPDA